MIHKVKPGVWFLLEQNLQNHLAIQLEKTIFNMDMEIHGPHPMT